MSARAEARRIYDEYFTTEIGKQRHQDATLLYPNCNLGGVDTDNAADFIVEGIAKDAAPFAVGIEEALHMMAIARLKDDWASGQGVDDIGQGHGHW